MPPEHPYHISQVAVVVRDIDAAMKAYHEPSAGVPGTSTSTSRPSSTASTSGARRQDYSMIGAECEVQPGLVFELIQPLEGDSIYKEHLDRYGEGVQHIAMMQHSPEESDEFKQRFAEAGYPVSMGGRIGDTIEFYYLDTMPLVHFVAESGSGHAIELTPVRQYPPA